MTNIKRKNARDCYYDLRQFLSEYCSNNMEWLATGDELDEAYASLMGELDNILEEE